MHKWTKLGIDDINIKETDELKYGYANMVLMEMSMYNECFLLYNKFISLASSLVKELSLPNNSISLSFIIGHLIKMGAFSFANNYIDKNKKAYYSKEGIGIVLGYGVCRHFTSLQKDIFDELDIYNKKYSCISKNILTKEKVTGKANHLANVVNYMGVYYVYDSYNEEFYRFIKGNIASEYNVNRYLYFKPEYLMWDEGISKKEVLERLKMYEISSKFLQISEKEYFEIKNESFNNLENNIKLISEFTIDTYDIKSKILSKTI